MTVSEALAEARRQLAGHPVGALEADLLLRHVLGVDRAWLYANGDRQIDDVTEQSYGDLVARRLAGEPIAYITGVREFWSLPLRVTPGVLIPRPDTELLVEVALSFLPGNAPRRVADLGTGSGAVALAIASERPDCEVHATESSPAALQVARSNGENLLPGRVVFREGSWFDPLEGRFDLVVSNPPYIDSEDHHLEEGDVRHEPRSALTPGGNSLSAIREIAENAQEYLLPGGRLAFEHGFDQGASAREILQELGYVEIDTHQDLEKRDRVTSGKLKN